MEDKRERTNAGSQVVGCFKDRLTIMVVDYSWFLVCLYTWSKKTAKVVGSTKERV